MRARDAAKHIVGVCPLPVCLPCEHQLEQGCHQAMPRGKSSIFLENYMSGAPTKSLQQGDVCVLAGWMHICKGWMEG